MGLGVVGGEVAWWAAESVVEGDGGCEGGEAADESCSEGVQGAGAVAFDGQDVFGGPEDALDALADRGEVWSSSGFVFAARANDCRVQRVDLGLEVFAGVALVADDDDMARAVDTLQQSECDVAFTDLGTGQRQGPGGAVGREQGVQPEAVEVAAVAGAVAVVGGVGECASARLLAPPRLTVSRERQHSTGVESISSTSSS
jgi:hypothetical protein